MGTCLILIAYVTPGASEDEGHTACDVKHLCVTKSDNDHNLLTALSAGKTIVGKFTPVAGETEDHTFHLLKDVDGSPVPKAAGSSTKNVGTPDGDTTAVDKNLFRRSGDTAAGTDGDEVIAKCSPTKDKKTTPTFENENPDFTHFENLMASGKAAGSHRKHRPRNPPNPP